MPFHRWHWLRFSIFDILISLALSRVEFIWSGLCLATPTHVIMPFISMPLANAAHYCPPTLFWRTSQVLARECYYFILGNIGHFSRLQPRLCRVFVFPLFSKHNIACSLLPSVTAFIYALLTRSIDRLRSLYLIPISLISSVRLRQSTISYTPHCHSQYCHYHYFIE
jgi:hypothetical protein